MKTNPKITQEEYKNVFGTCYESIYASPARTNLIGEHLDYNGGVVLPCAISLYVYAYINKRSDEKVCLYTSSKNVSKNYIEVDLNSLEYSTDNSWANYPIGLVYLLKKNKENIKTGFNVYYDSEIPVGCGLSSSAAILVLTANYLCDLYNFELTEKEIVDYTVLTEREYIGVNSGIMDEAIIALAKDDMCLLLDCANFSYSYIPFILRGYSLLVLNTNKHRLLQESKYNERVDECTKALDILKKHYSINSLSELKVEELENIKKYLGDDLLYKRVSYIVLENKRVIDFKSELEGGSPDIIKLASILNEGHKGLKEDYEVSGYHLDKICELALKCGAIGARMTGAGFGGCAIAIVESSDVDRFSDMLKATYLKETGLNCEVYSVDIVGSSKKLC